MTTNDKPLQKMSVIQIEIEKALEQFNTILFNGKLENVLITLQTKGRGNFAGWCWAEKWAGKESSHTEINISAEYLTAGYEPLMEVLIHEMAHAINSQNGIPDCSKTQYHNKNFKKAGELAGLCVEKGEKERLGWAYTSIAKGGIAEKALKDINIDRDVFIYQRKEQGSKVKAPTKMKKWSCGCTNVRCAVELLAECQDCGNEFIKQ
jgi:hypothetical protein